VDGDKIARGFPGAGGSGWQTAAAGRNQRERQSGVFDEFPAGNRSVTHDGLTRALTSVKSLQWIIRILKLMRCENMEIGRRGVKSF
jgi:hypothetical protein